MSLEINALLETIKVKKGEMKNISSLTFEDIISLQKEIDKLNDEITEKQRAILASKDAIKKRASDLQTETIKQPAGEAELTNIMTFSFEIA